MWYKILPKQDSLLQAIYCRSLKYENKEKCNSTKKNVPFPHTYLKLF